MTKKAGWVTSLQCDCVNHLENEECGGCGSPLTTNQPKAEEHPAPEATPTVDATPKSDPADSNWQKLGKITIDTGRLLLIDPGLGIANVGELVEAEFAQLPIPGGDFSAVVVGTGMGDGRYTVEGRYVGGYLGADEEGEA